MSSLAVRLPTWVSEQTANSRSGIAASDGPLLERLGEQRDRRHQEERRAPGRHEVLGDLQRGEGLAGAAGHDQLAPVCDGEPGQHLLQGDDLVRAELLLRVRQLDLGPGSATLNCDQSTGLASRSWTRSRVTGIC